MKCSIDLQITPSQRQYQGPIFHEKWSQRRKHFLGRPETAILWTFQKSYYINLWWEMLAKTKPGLEQGPS